MLRTFQMTLIQSKTKSNSTKSNFLIDSNAFLCLQEAAFSRASLIFQKRFPDAVGSSKRQNIASTSCTRSYIITKKKNIFQKIEIRGPVNAHLISEPIISTKPVYNRVLRLRDFLVQKAIILIHI